MEDRAAEAVDDYLPEGIRRALEERLWRPIATRASLEALLDDPLFLEDPGHHPAMFADHGVVHVRDVAAGLLQLLDTVDGVLLAARPPARRRFVAQLGVAQTYLHDIGMVDLSPTGRRTHAEYAAHAAFGTDVDGLVAHLLGETDLGARVARVAADAPLAVTQETLVRELLALVVAHSKSVVPAEVLDDRPALRARVRSVVATPLAAHRGATAATGPAAPFPEDVLRRRVDHEDAFAWLEAEDGPQSELADDAVDAVRLLRAADVLRQRGTSLRTSGGFEVFFDAATAHAVCALRTADGSATHLVRYEDRRGAGEANIRVAFVTPGGDLRVAVHRGRFADDVATARAVDSVSDALLDIQADVVGAFGGSPARGLPAPTRHGRPMRVEVERPEDAPGFADAVVAAVQGAEPALSGRVAAVADVERADAAERSRYHHAVPAAVGRAAATRLLAELAGRGVDLGVDPGPELLDEVRRAPVGAGEVLLRRGTPPAFVYVPLGPGLVVHPGGGYPPEPLTPWVPVGTTGAVRRAERNADVVAERAVEVLVVPAERYLGSWWNPLTPRDLRDRFTAREVC